MKCKKCGFNNQENIQFCENCGTDMASVKKKGGKLKAFIATVLSIAIPVGIPIAIRNGVREYNRQQNESDQLEYLKYVDVESISNYLNGKEYKKGVLEGNTYKNEFWNIKFEAPNDWIMFTKEEIVSYMGEDTEGFSHEMVAVSMASDIEINVIGEKLPINNYSIDNYIKAIKKNLGLNMETREKARIICDKEYTVLTGESDDFAMDVYVRINESRSFCIVIKHLNKSQEEIDSVIDFFSLYEELE